MPRRRSRVPRNLMILGALAAAGWAGWHFAPQSVRDAWRSDAGRVRAESEIDVCALATADDLAKLVGRVAVEARHPGQQDGIPAAGACNWRFFGGSVTARVFTPASLRRGGVESTAVDYFRSVVTGLEYEFKQEPLVIDGVGDEAVISAGGQEPQQLAVRHGDRVLTLEYAGIDRATAESLARSLVAG